MITYPVTEEVTVAAPVMAHVVALMVRPAGRVGTEVQAVKVVPPAVHALRQGPKNLESILEVSGLSR